VLIEPQIPSIKNTGIANASKAIKKDNKLVVWKHHKRNPNIVQRYKEYNR